MPRTNLTDARIGALVPRRISYDIRDGKQAFEGKRTGDATGRRCEIPGS